MENISLVAIDLAKTSFQVRAVNKGGRALINKRVYRSDLLSEVMKAPKGCCIAMEACSGAHHWGREFTKHGYEVKLIAPQFVRPFRKSQKNDAADAEAIAEAASRESMRLVALKTEEQQEVQVLHRVRSRLIKARVALTNEMRGIAAEFGYVMPQGTAALKKWLATLEETSLSEPMKLVLRNLYEELLAVEERVGFYDKKVACVSQSNDLCKRGLTVPGVGPTIATAVFAAIGKGQQFKNGRAFAASLGLVPSQYSTGGKSTLANEATATCGSSLYKERGAL